MLGKYFFHKKQGHFYRLGEEIYIDENKGFIVDDSISSVKVRIFIAVSAFIIIFTILIFSLFNLCVLQANETTTPTYYSSNDNIIDDMMDQISLSIKRADILDRNGTIIATSLPTVHLHANASKIDNKKETEICI